MNFNEFSSERLSEKSEAIRERVTEARNIQLKRFEEKADVFCNAQMSPNMVRNICRINESLQVFYKQSMQKLGLSARAYDRILKVSRTIADLAGSEEIQLEHLAEAIHYQSLDQEGWVG